MSNGFFLVAIALLVIGHIFKGMRWQQLILSYEKIKLTSLLEILSVGQIINMIIPLRVGDLFRIYRLGKRHLANGYFLSTATVILDIVIDTFVVGFTFVTLYILNIHRDIIINTVGLYMVISICLFLAILLIFIFKKKIKSLILIFSKIFNENLQRKILMGFYTLFNLRRNIKSEGMIKISVYTCFMWICYFTSYEFFAKTLQLKGLDYTLTSIFETMFSSAFDPFLIEGVYYKGENMYIYFLIYLIIPLVCIYAFVFIYNKFINKKEYAQRSRILPQVKAEEKLNFLGLYFSSEKRKYLDNYLDINKDVTVIQDYSAGSNASTILCLKNGENFYRKYIYGEEGKNLYKQVCWIEKYKELLPVAEILNAKITDNYCFYDMKYHEEAISFFKYIHTTKLEYSEYILVDIINKLEKQIYKSKDNENNLNNLNEYILKKVTQNIKLCNEWLNIYYKDVARSKYIIINGLQYKNLSWFEKKLNNELFDLFKNDKYNVIHGDLTIENIVCRQGEKEGWYLIDPNESDLYSTAFIDYAKLLQSLHGKYEFLTGIRDFNVIDNRIEFIFTESTAYNDLYEKLKNILQEKFSHKEIESIFYHEIIHWLRLMPYKIRANPRQAIIFYAGLVKVINEVEVMFDEQK